MHEGRWNARGAGPCSGQVGWGPTPLATSVADLLATEPQPDRPLHCLPHAPPGICRGVEEDV